MKNKFFCFALCSIIFSFMLAPARAAAESSCTLMQTYMYEDKLDIVARGDFDLQSASVKVSNRQSEIAEYGSVSEGKIRVRTTVLVDVSTSMPYNTRSKVIEFIEEKIKELAGYEELRLVTFGDKIEVVQDFSSDRYDLSSAVKEIEFNGMASAVYDAINSTITTPGAEDGSHCFYHTIVMTDGIDDTAGGITKEELFMRLRAETYPIDVIGVSAEKLSNPDKDLAALSRISNGFYAELYSGSDVSKCVSEVSASDLFWIRAQVPADLLDGSTRQVDVYDGNSSFSYDMKMSMADVSAESTVSSSEEESSVAESSVPVFAPPESLSSDTTSDSDGAEENDPKTIIIIVATGGCVLIAAVLVAVLSSVKRKKNKHSAGAPCTEPYAPSNETDSGRTELLSDGALQVSYTIKLSSCGDPDQNWTLTVTKDVLVGRADNCELKFIDSSVSREQFRLSACDSGVMLTNISTSNVTKVNNAVGEDIMLQPGDIIKFGRISLSVDLIQKISGNVDSGSSSGDTVTVF